MNTTARTSGVGELIKERRLNPDRPLKQRELASKIGVDPITVSRWERGATTPSDIHRVLLAKALGGRAVDYLDGAELQAVKA